MKKKIKLKNKFNLDINSNLSLKFKKMKTQINIMKYVKWNRNTEQKNNDIRNDNN